MSLDRGPTDGDVDMLDLRADFARVFQGSRTVVAEEFTIDVHWMTPR